MNEKNHAAQLFIGMCMQTNICCASRNAEKSARKLKNYTKM